MAAILSEFISSPSPKTLLNLRHGGGSTYPQATADASSEPEDQQHDQHKTQQPAAVMWPAPAGYSIDAIAPRANAQDLWGVSGGGVFAPLLADALKEQLGAENKRQGRLKCFRSYASRGPQRTDSLESSLQCCQGERQS